MQFISSEYSVGRLYGEFLHWTRHLPVCVPVCDAGSRLSLFGDVIGAVHDVMTDCLGDTTTITETGFVSTYLMEVCVQATSAEVCLP